jgi:hypothetical protein
MDISVVHSGLSSVLLRSSPCCAGVDCCYTHMV